MNEKMMKASMAFPKSKILSVNGIELEVFEAGQENAGNPIVLCHGWPEHAFSWRYQIPVLAEAGYHVIVPNQRGYGHSTCPTEISDYDIDHLTGDLVGLLDHYGYDDAVFVGHDWGSVVVYNMTLLHPARVSRLINLSVPYLERGVKPWVEFLEDILGPDNYFVHFNRNLGLADAIFDEHAHQFLRNLYRKNIPVSEPKPGMTFINLAREERPQGDPVMSDDDLQVFVSAFQKSGFTGGINWYRNLDRNWHRLAEVDPVINQPALMIYGDQDTVQKSMNLSDFVPRVEIVNLNCGHWIQQELPEETNAVIIDWLKKTKA